MLSYMIKQADNREFMHDIKMFAGNNPKFLGGLLGAGVGAGIGGLVDGWSGAGIGAGIGGLGGASLGESYRVGRFGETYRDRELLNVAKNKMREALKESVPHFEGIYSKSKNLENVPTFHTDNWDEIANALPSIGADQIAGEVKNVARKYLTGN